MIELFTAPTPNGWKVGIMLEECGLPYQARLVDLGKGEQREDWLHGASIVTKVD